MSLASFASVSKWEQWRLPSQHHFDNEIKISTL